MKKLLSLTLLFLTGIGSARSQTCSTTITTYPYYQNFEAGPAGWTSGGSNSSWALGTPAKTVINSAASGTKSWVTNLTGNYNPSEQSFVESPCFNTTSLVAPMIEMKIWWNSEFSWDGAVLQSSIDNGNSWQVVGAFGDPNNWYTDNTLGGGPGGQPIATAAGWTGRKTSNNGSGGWVTAKHALTGLGGKASVKLRIAFGSDPSIMDEGFAFDDLSVFDTPANDASPLAITSPAASVQPNVSTPITVTLKNLGTASLTSATLGFSVNGTVAVNNYAFNGNVATNQTATGITIGNYSFPAGIHTLKAWSKLPNGAPDGNPGNDTIIAIFYSCNSLNGTYTINKNIAASATNFQSFDAAVQTMKNCGISGPVVFNVAGGPYTESVKIGNINGASATNTITFNGNGNSLISASNPLDALTLDGAKYLRFNNLRIKVAPTDMDGAVVSLVNAAQYNVFNNCSFNHSISTSATSYCVSLTAGSSNNTFQGDTLIGSYYSIYHYATTAAINTGNQFIGNVIKDPYYYGFYCGYSTNILFEGNDISRSARTNGNTFYCHYITTGSTGITISKNRIHNTHDMATSTNGSVYGVYNVSPAAVGQENIIKNNLFYNINNPGGSFYAFYNSGGNNSYYYHNSVSLDNPGITYATIRGIYFGGTVTNVKFINNSISLSSPAASKHAIYMSTTAIPVVSNNNNLYVGSSGNIGYYSADKATLADWKAVNSNAYDQNSVSADPMYVNAATGNLKPINSALNAAGQAIAAVTDDITGAPRNTTTPDIGAYEFTPAANDAGIATIVSPTNPVVPNASLPITVALKNYGLSPLTAVTITWTVNGTAQASYNWTGSLANNQSANVTIGNYSFPAGSHTLNICTSAPNGQTDPNQGNDCQAMTVISCNSLTGIFTINKNAAASATNFTTFASAFSTLNNCGVSGPVTLDVVSGTGPYNEIFVAGNVNGTSATNTITINGNGNILSSPMVGAEAVIKLDGAKYFRFNNLKAEVNANTTSSSVVWLTNGAMYNTFSGNTFTHSIATNISSSQVVYITNGSNSNTFQNNTLIGAYAGFNNSGTSAVLNTDNQLKGNIIKDPYNYGIQNIYATGTLIEGNDISRPARTNATTLYGIYVATSSTGITINKNRIHNTHDVAASTNGSVYGIYTSVAGTPGAENIVKNNALYNINNYSGYLYALYCTNSNTYFYNNTVAATSTTGTYNTLRGIYIVGAVTNVKCINNNISLTSTATTKHAIYLSSSGASVISNNNNLHAPGGNVGYFSADRATLADWKAVNANAYDQASVSVDPGFVNTATGDLRPTVVDLNNTAQPLVAITDDINGAPRSNTTPDIGAFEFSINPNDVGVISVAGPSVTGCGLSAAESITITFKNFGTTTQTSIPVKYTLNGTPVNETWTGSLISNATATYTFTGKANMSTSGNYAIYASTKLTGDTDATNDSTALNITNSLIPGLPMTFDFETATTGISRFRKVSNAKSNIVEDPAASFGTGTKGMIMDGIDNQNWVTPAGTTNPWTNNPDNFAAAYICIAPAGGLASDSLWLTLDLKQLFKTANPNTNFRVTVNGTQVGATYRPPFTGTPINWQKLKFDLTAFKNDPIVTIGLESSVREVFANGTGTANLIDNVKILRRLVVSSPTGVKENTLASQLHVFPNPSTGNFYVSLENGKEYELKVTDLAGKVILTQVAKGDTQLNLENAAKGIYLLKVSSQGNTTVKKLIVE